ncbi:MAG: phosphatidate cytidylyltransferase [Selenomonadaceae bacterium]|nr:phosphatidate cytidylyltransferase [Selenomonadaceae bacterium]MBR6343632.1 phosphatidate cytidylyltransferase [Selenomonadaceae bacterium]
MVTRILTGIVGIALAAFIIQTGDWPFAAFALVLPLIGWYEYSKAFIKKGLRTAFILGILGITLIWGCAWLGNMEEMVAVVTGITLVTLLLTVFLHGRISPVEAGISVGGILYVGIPFAHLVMLRFLDDRVIATQLGGFELGCAYVWVMFIGTWASDTFAYFTGSAIGSHKLCPSISPNKTVEGFLGSVVGTTASIAALGHLFFGFPLPEMAVLGVLLSLFATLGDLVESVIKRHTGIKDSGSLIPGHGGVLDRFDSVLYTAPMVYYFALITQWMEK